MQYVFSALQSPVTYKVFVSKDRTSAVGESGLPLHDYCQCPVADVENLALPILLCPEHYCYFKRDYIFFNCLGTKWKTKRANKCNVP
ncbi:hypothetical protein FKM82_024936 [Ascaphus truei]